MLSGALQERFNFSEVLTKFPFWQRGWALGYHSMGLDTYLTFPNFEILSRSATRDTSRIYHVYKVIITHRFTCDERKIW